MLFDSSLIRSSLIGALFVAGLQTGCSRSSLSNNSSATKLAAVPDASAGMTQSEFKQVVDLLHSLQLPNNEFQEGCDFRAWYMGYALMHAGFAANLLWANNVDLNPSHLYHGNLPYQGYSDISWTMHVAPIFKVEGRWLVVDGTTQTEPVAPETWLNDMGAKNSQYAKFYITPFDEHHYESNKPPVNVDKFSIKDNSKLDLKDFKVIDQEMVEQNKCDLSFRYADNDEFGWDADERKIIHAASMEFIATDDAMTKDMIKTQRVKASKRPDFKPLTAQECYEIEMDSEPDSPQERGNDPEKK